LNSHIKWGDGIELMKDLPHKSINLLLTDLPYSMKNRNRVTGNFWDLPIDIEEFWSESKRLITPDGAIVLTATNPFSSFLVMSNLDMFKYEWVWEKDNGTNFTSVNWQPFRKHEHVLVFGYGATTFTKSQNYMKYFPQKTAGLPYTCKAGNSKRPNLQGADCSGYLTVNTGDRHPSSIQRFPRDKKAKFHPTQKPISLFEFLIKSYTNEDDIVLDTCAGSFTTAIACLNTGRRYICFEKDETYFKKGKERIETHETSTRITDDEPKSLERLLK